VHKLPASRWHGLFSDLESLDAALPGIRGRGDWIVGSYFPRQSAWYQPSMLSLPALSRFLKLNHSAAGESFLVGTESRMHVVGVHLQPDHRTFNSF